MNIFNSFNITVTARGFEGDKIKMSKILNREIEVHDFKIEPSKVFQDRGTGQCLHLQIAINGDKHIVFTSATALIEAIQKVPKDGFPFKTVIKQDGERFLFT